MDIKSRKRFRVFKNNTGQLTFICCICNASNLRLIEVENHFRSHNDPLTEVGSSKPENVKNGNEERITSLDNHLNPDIKVLKTKTKFSSDLLKRKCIRIPQIVTNSRPIPTNHQTSKIPSSNKRMSKKWKSYRTNNHLPTFDQYKCDMCDRLCPNRSRIARHIRTVHKNRALICNICGSSFKMLQALREHLNRHFKIKRYTCDECGKGFVTSSHLSRHMAVHTGGKKYMCKDCGRIYTSSSILRSHERQTHIRERNHKCDHPGCDRAYFKLCDLNVHKRCHTGDRPLSCTVCKKTFAIPRNLRHHMNLHDVDKKYQCKFCPIKFAQWATRKNHEKRVHALV